MKISIDIVEHDVRDYVVKKHILDTSEVCLLKCAFYDPTEAISNETIYLCRNVEQIDADNLPYNSNLIFMESIPVDIAERLECANYFIVAGLPIHKFFNLLLGIFYRYNSFDEQFSSLIRCKCTYQKIIDLSTQMIEMPLCLINLNYQTIALSEVDIPDDALWEAMQNGYGLAYYDFIQRCEFKTEEMTKEGIPQKSMWSDVACNYLCVSVLYQNGRAIGSIGMHKWYERKKPFEKATLQLFNYVVTRMSELIQILQNIPESRYSPTDMFLLELLSGKRINNEVLAEMLEQTKLPLHGSFHLAIFSSKIALCRTEQLLDYMEMIEKAQPDLHCCIYNSTIVALHSTPPKQEFQVKKGLQDFLTGIDYTGIYSLEYNYLLETGKAYKTVEILKNDVLVQERTSCICYAHDYLLEYALTVLTKYMDISKLIHPVLKRLMEYDEHGKGDLYNVLRTFLYNRCSLKATSDAMFLHRNTLASRLANIKEITGVDWEDVDTYKQLIFSVSCMDYCQKNNKVPLPASENNSP